MKKLLYNLSNFGHLVTALYLNTKVYISNTLEGNKDYMVLCKRGILHKGCLGTLRSELLPLICNSSHPSQLPCPLALFLSLPLCCLCPPSDLIHVFDFVATLLNSLL